MQKIAINITKDFKVKAFVIREFEIDDASYSHKILYCQNKLIDYMVYPIYKEFNEDYKELLENQETEESIYISKEATEMRLVESSNGVNYYMEFVTKQGEKHGN